MEEQDCRAEGGRSGQFDFSSSSALSPSTSCCEQSLCATSRVGLTHLYRLHSDRAREFTGKLMRDWILSHDMEHTTTAADESAGNGRVESEIAHLKHHTKLLLTTARAPATYWPMSLRHASEYRFRKTLEQLGVPVPRLIPFGTEAIAKSKFWHRTYMKGFPTPMQKVRVW